MKFYTFSMPLNEDGTGGEVIACGNVSAVKKLLKQYPDGKGFYMSCASDGTMLGSGEITLGNNASKTYRERLNTSRVYRKKY
jgi:hypothetical protein